MTTTIEQTVTHDIVGDDIIQLGWIFGFMMPQSSSVTRDIDEETESIIVLIQTQDQYVRITKQAMCPTYRVKKCVKGTRGWMPLYDEHRIPTIGTGADNGVFHRYFA